MIIPTILTDNIDEVKEKFGLLAGQVDRVQIDIIDGKFADNLTIAPVDLLGLEESKGFSLDFHLMVDDPVVLLDCNWPGSTNQITGQIELMFSQIEFVRMAKEKGFSSGLAVDLETKITKLDIQALDLTDQVLLLGVKAGFGCQTIDPAVLVKIRELAVWRQKEHWSFKIGVDGGIDETSLAFSHKMGAEEFFVGSAIWQSNDPVGMLGKLGKLINN